MLHKHSQGWPLIRDPYHFKLHCKMFTNHIFMKRRFWVLLIKEGSRFFSPILLPKVESKSGKISRQKFSALSYSSCCLGFYNYPNWQLFGRDIKEFNNESNSSIPGRASHYAVFSGHDFPLPATMVYLNNDAQERHLLVFLTFHQKCCLLHHHLDQILFLQLHRKRLRKIWLCGHFVSDFFHGHFYVPLY